MTDYDLDGSAKLLDHVDPPLAGPSPMTVQQLKEIARAWMDDMHDFCNVTPYLDHLGEEQTTFMKHVREFRRSRPWLRNNLGPDDFFDYVSPIEGSVDYRFLRRGPDGEDIFGIVHMEGRPVVDVDPTAATNIPNLGDGWEVALRAPGIPSEYRGGPVTLHDGMGVLYTRRRALGADVKLGGKIHG